LFITVEKKLAGILMQKFDHLSQYYKNLANLSVDMKLVLNIYI